MVPSCHHPLSALVLAVILALAGCSGGPKDYLEPDDDSAADDDDSAGDDDDDSAAGDDDDLSDLGIRFVTFAAMLDGSAAGTSRPGAESTDITGSFQFVYWSDLDSGKIVCRQRYLFEATARFGTAELTTCSECGGQLSIILVHNDDKSHSDACPPLPESVDLSFLLTAADIVTPADFRELALVSLDRLQEADWQLSGAGMPASEIDQSYEEAGLDAYWIAMISSNGWLGAEAGLGETANRWDADAALLPMFVAYRNPSENPAGWALDGSCFLSTLWVVRVGASSGAEPLP